MDLSEKEYDMKKRKRLFGALLVILALIIMQLPVSEADAATPSASDFKMEGSTLVKYRGTEKNVSIPDTVEVIGKGAFEDNTNIELVVVPNSVKRIERYAFWGCDNLDTVVLGRGLTTVGDYVFAGCKGLKQMTIPSNVTSIGVQAFGDCVNLKDITIPAKTTSIHETAFVGCYQLIIHADPGSVADAYAKDFYEKLKEMAEYQDVPGYDPSGDSQGGQNDNQTATPTPTPVATPEPSYPVGEEIGSTQVVGNRAVVFINASSLDVLGAGDNIAILQTPAADFSAGTQASGIPKFTIVDGSIVADQAYYRNADLESITLPEGIREIGQFSFARSALRKIALPEGVETISYGAFYHCDNLNTVQLPETVMNVEPKAFSYTGWVKNFLNGRTGEGDFLISGGVLVAYRGNSKDVSVPQNVRVIAAEVFLGHDEITSVTLPRSLRVIGEGAFEDCTSLSDINLNIGLEQIKDRAFLNCVAELVQVPSTVDTVGLRAFENINVEYTRHDPKISYEITATRLSNEAYRAPEPDADAVAAGVVVDMPDGASAVLEGAARSYVLQIAKSDDTSSTARAFQRAFGSNLPKGTWVYDMQLTDNSEIPLTKLGRQFLTVVLPLPDSLKGQEIRVFALDRNGQLEEIASELVTVNGKAAVRFQTNFLSQISLCPTGAAAGKLIEINVDMGSLSGPPETLIGTMSDGKVVKFIISGAMLLTGLVLLFTAKKKRERSIV